ncbi:Crp/Fnr family transcriptional regulator [Albibacterium indicum]|uniref:Crp/Fnr family transcriptional regulator n=1 Tax=Albibacterium indicum TaxID=2292082 RepID=UPI000E507BF5|nr:Crp/Fnr family transcriptional regulator [Pedobacter indicus]
MKLNQILDFISPLPEPSKAKLRKCVREVSLPKGHIILRADKIEKNLYFIKKGIARGYSYIEENEVTFWFGREGDAIISMRSYVDSQRGYENIELLEASDLYQINGDRLQQLYIEDIHLANWGRKFSEKEIIKTEERLISLQFLTATERYQEMLKKSPDLINRVQLGYIASYLGITQVSLSRIRAEIK